MKNTFFIYLGFESFCKIVKFKRCNDNYTYSEKKKIVIWMISKRKFLTSWVELFCKSVGEDNFKV